ncbi:MAG: polysaccharide (de)acetylase [Flavobacterium sp.]|nr:MAG: polysaccharide (de)acetylase [Flavobacterium sp.]
MSVISDFKNSFLKNVRNLNGWTTKRKIVVFESDDWGAIRMPSKEAYNALLAKGLPVTKSFYNINDCLESNQDMEALFGLLSKYKDKMGNHPKFTAISIVANPDFDKIKENGFTKYEYEEVAKTLERYGSSHDEVQNLYRQGIDSGLYWAESHGREHLHVKRWMETLNTPGSESRISFDYGFYGLGGSDTLGAGKTFMPAFDIDTVDEVIGQAEIMKESVAIFEKTFGYKPEYFVPPNSAVSTKLEPLLKDFGIKYIIGARHQKEPLGNGRFTHNYRYLGKRNDSGQMYLSRNCLFEHAGSSSERHEECLRDIQIAFNWKKPAVISTHRVKYIGHLNEKNRKEGLEQLDLLLKAILKKWPDVEFMDSRQLAHLVDSRN